MRPPTLGGGVRHPGRAARVLFLALVALTIVVSLQAVGIILVVAMLVTPAATAQMLTVRFTRLMAVAAIVGISSAIIGLYLSYWLDVASGATIVLVQTAMFLLALVIGPRGVRRRRAIGIALEGQASRPMRWSRPRDAGYRLTSRVARSPAWSPRARVTSRPPTSRPTPVADDCGSGARRSSARWTCSPTSASSSTSTSRTASTPTSAATPSPPTTTTPSAPVAAGHRTSRTWASPTSWSRSATATPSP
jgi:hypothetical protein